MNNWQKLTECKVCRETFRSVDPAGRSSIMAECRCGSFDPEQVFERSRPRAIGRVTRIAYMDGRSYITPEDITEARKHLGHAPPSEIWREVLQVLGRFTGWSAEDWSLCAFVAVKAEPVESAGWHEAEGREERG